MATRRQLLASEKDTVRKQQMEADGSIRCFISGQPITESSDIEYDHLHPYAQDGETSLSNIRIVLKEFNRRKSDQSLYEVRDNLKLEGLFESKKNNIKLQDILELKGVKRKNFYARFAADAILLDDGTTKRSFALLRDNILGADYFYGRIPVEWLENDDQEGLQPRVIDYKRLISIRDHLKIHPQLAPSIARLLDMRLKLFDGQHKLAAQVLNGQTEMDVKVYVSPPAVDGAKKLFDALMITNLEAHSKLKQVPFYTSTLLDRLSAIYKELLEEFISSQAVEKHSEANFVHFLAVSKQFSRSDAKEMLRSAIKSAALSGSELDKYVAEASKDATFPVTIDLLNKNIFPATIFLEPSKARFTADDDFRSSETQNFRDLASILVKEALLPDWVQHVRGKSFTDRQLKSRRIWLKGAVLTWAPYLKSVLYFALHTMTTEERDRLLHREPLTDQHKKIIQGCLSRLFSHPMWDEPEGEIDSLLGSARKQEELFQRKGLTEKFVVQGVA
jgi:hypothetical protein